MTLLTLHPAQDAAGKHVQPISHVRTTGDGLGEGRRGWGGSVRGEGAIGGAVVPCAEDRVPRSLGWLWPRGRHLGAGTIVGLRTGTIHLPVVYNGTLQQYAKTILRCEEHIYTNTVVYSRSRVQL